MTKYFFKSQYQPCTYSPNWYGTLDLAPTATVILYDDNENICIGYVESIEAKNILEQYATISFYETEADMEDDYEIYSIEDEHVWFGDRLIHRWDVVEDGGVA